MIFHRKMAVAGLVSFAALLGSVLGCGYPGSPSHATVNLTPALIRPGTAANYECEPGFELLGPSRRICSTNGTWTPAGIPFCVLNVAAGKAPMQSSVALGGVPERAVDGSTSNFFTAETCTMTAVERGPWWYVNLLEPYMVQLVRLDFGKACCGNGKPATIVVRVGNNRPDLGVNAVCNRFTGFIEEGRPLFLPCNPPMPGAFVSVHLEGQPQGSSLSICEAFVYTDQALPIERCPQFRDQEPGSSATYNGKCYLFHNNGPLSFNEARQFCDARGGSLIDETNPALQGFISWELWRRHARNDPNGQYWMGARRDLQDRSNWKWLSGKDVTVSFWNLPGGNENCARYDGTKGWLWADTNCNRRLHFICQHRPKSCGRPEQPANGTLVTESFNVGNRIEYRCDPGHMAVGPTVRTCLPSGFYSEYPPICKHVQCGLPARIPSGSYRLVNNTRHYLSLVSYSCVEGYQLIGRGDLICDVDGRWNGPPPRCEPVYCLEPPQIPNGGFRLSTNSTLAGTVVDYYCLSLRFKLSGPSRLVCQPDGHYDRDPPVCTDNEIADSANARNNAPPNVNEPTNKENSAAGDAAFGGRLNIGGIIALGVFGGFVFLAAIITTFVIVLRRIRNDKRYRRRSSGGGGGGGSGNTASAAAAAFDAGGGGAPSGGGGGGVGLQKFYRQAWDNLQEPSGKRSKSHHHNHHHGGGGHHHADADAEPYRGRGGADDGGEAAAGASKHGDKKRHHHHHHHHHKPCKRSAGGEW